MTATATTTTTTTTTTKMMTTVTTTATTTIKTTTTMTTTAATTTTTNTTTTSANAAASSCPKSREQQEQEERNHSYATAVTCKVTRTTVFRTQTSHTALTKYEVVVGQLGVPDLLVQSGAVIQIHVHHESRIPDALLYLFEWIDGQTNE